MSAIKVNEIKPMKGSEGSLIRQIFHPHNTLNGIRCSIAHFTLAETKQSKIHKMKTAEVYYILDGEGILHIDDEEIAIKKDVAAYVPPMSKQYIENTGKTELKFLCIVDPAWREIDEIRSE